MAANKPTTKASWPKLVALRGLYLVAFCAFVLISDPNPAVKPWLWWLWVAVTGLHLFVQFATALALRR